MLTGLRPRWVHWSTNAASHRLYHSGNISRKWKTQQRSQVAEVVPARHDVWRAFVWPGSNENPPQQKFGLCRECRKICRYPPTPVDDGQINGGYLECAEMLVSVRWCSQQFCWLSFFLQLVANLANNHCFLQFRVVYIRGTLYSTWYLLLL